MALELDARVGVLLVGALVLNIGWLWPPLGIAGMAVASMALLRATEDMWSRRSQVAVLVVAWIPMLWMVLTSGMTVGIAGRRLFALGGGEDNLLLRAVAGAAVPAIAAALIATGSTGWPRRLALAGAVVAVLLIPAAFWAGGAIQMDPEDPRIGEAATPWADRALVVPFVLVYALVVAGAVLVWRAGSQASAGSPGDRTPRADQG